MASHYGLRVFPRQVAMYLCRKESTLRTGTLRAPGFKSSSRRWILGEVADRSDRRSDLIAHEKAVALGFRSSRNEAYEVVATPLRIEVLSPASLR